MSGGFSAADADFTPVTGHGGHFGRHLDRALFKIERGRGAGEVVKGCLIILEQIGHPHGVAGVGSDAAHDGHQSGFGDIFGLVEGFASQHAADEVHMLLDIGVAGIRGDRSDVHLFAGDFTTAITDAFGAGEHFANIAMGAGYLPTLAMNVHSVAEIQVDAEKVVLIAGYPSCTPPVANCLFGMFSPL